MDTFFGSRTDLQHGGLDSGCTTLQGRSSAQGVLAPFSTLPLERQSNESSHFSNGAQASSSSSSSSSGPLGNFVRFSLAGSAVPAATLACFGLASPRLGNAVGARQSGLLYASYTLTALTGATGAVEAWGSKRALLIGMALMNMYVGCFVGATLVRANWLPVMAYLGAVVGGIGAGIFWTAQGTYFVSAAQKLTADRPSTTTAWLAGCFATVLLLEETLLDSLSTLLVRHWKVSWRAVFTVYAAVAVIASIAARRVCDYQFRPISPPHPSPCSEATAALHLLLRDSKTKYLCGLPAVFGLAGGFVNSFVSGEVVPVALATTNATTTTGGSSATPSLSADTWVGLLAAVHGLAATLTSWLLAWIEAVPSSSLPTVDNASNREDCVHSDRATYRDVPQLRDFAILILGCWTFGAVGVCFLQLPRPADWTWKRLVAVYALQGVGRATFEATLKAVVAKSYAARDREGAFANIVGHNGLWSSAAYFSLVHLKCRPPTSGSDLTSVPHCWQYRDGSWRSIGLLAWVLVLGSAVASLGYVRAWFLLRSTILGPASRRGCSTQDLQPLPHLHASHRALSYQTVDTDECDDAGTELREMT